MRSAERFEILIVEDDVHLRELLQAAAERTGKFSRVRVAADGEEALQQVREGMAHHEVPDFILSDLSMPRMDGIHLIRELKHNEATRHIPIAVITSSNRPNDREDAEAAGCCAFFNKPVRLDDMTVLIGSVPDICAANAPVSSPLRD